jgi:hypothetical protein
VDPALLLLPPVQFGSDIASSILSEGIMEADDGKEGEATEESDGSLWRLPCLPSRWLRWRTHPKMTQRPTPILVKVSSMNFKICCFQLHWQASSIVLVQMEIRFNNFGRLIRLMGSEPRESNSGLPILRWKMI